jgi:predicted DNA-binding protein
MKITAENTNIRITPRSRAVLRALSKQEGRSMQAVLGEAIAHYQRDKFLDEVNAAYATLRKNPKAWKEEQTERVLWNNTFAGGLKE